MEKESGIELDWYKEYFVYTTKTIDYAVGPVEARGDQTAVTFQRIGLMPMPLDIVVTYKDGAQEQIYMPLVIMRGEKANEEGMPTRVYTEDWPWVNLEKTIVLDRKLEDIQSIEIDPSKRMADVMPENNKVEF